MDAAGGQLFCRTELVPRFALDCHVVVQHDTDEAASLACPDQGCDDFERSNEKPSMVTLSPGAAFEMIFTAVS